MTRSKQTLHNQKTNETHCGFSSHAPATWIRFLVFLWSKKGWGENSTFSLKSGVWQCTKVPTEKGKKKSPKSFLKRFVTVAADSHHPSSDSKIIHQFLLPAQRVQLQSFPWNDKRVSNPWVPMSWTSLFSLYKTGFKLWALMSSIVQSFMDQKDFFPFDYWNWKKSCTVLKKSDQLLWQNQSTGLFGCLCKKTSDQKPVK